MRERDQPLRVLIADDDEPFRAALDALFDSDPRFTICASVGDAPSAVAAALAEVPDACLLDVCMPGSGISAAAEISAQLPETAVVMLSGSQQDSDVFRSLRAGATGYILKVDLSEVPARLIEAVQTGATLTQMLLAQVVGRLRDPSALRRTLRNSNTDLTSREWQILQLLREGLSTAQVAQRLSLSAATVRVHRARIANKLRAAGASEAECDELLHRAPNSEASTPLRRLDHQRRMHRAPA